MKNGIVLTVLVAALLAGAAQAGGGAPQTAGGQVLYRVTNLPAPGRHLQRRLQHQRPAAGSPAAPTCQATRAGMRPCGATESSPTSARSAGPTARCCGR